MLKKSFLNIIFLFFCFHYAISQEVVTGLQSNPLLKNARKNASKSLTQEDLELPFFDDFSGTDIFPDDQKWADDYVFINDTYTDKQLTKGVATFDALDNIGRLYETASSTGFEADQLTSRPINLEYTPGEDIWLSFFYQPGGLADMPEEKDSLTLRFYAPDEDKWYSVWRALADNPGDFQAATVKIEHTRFLKQGFRFRFTNYGSLSDNLSEPSMIGNCDQWNIDYIILDKNRKETDTLYADVAFRLPLRSLLNSHEAMPWKQFKQISLQEMGLTIPIHYRNNDTIVRNITRNFRIWDVYEDELAESFSAGAVNINPLTDEDYEASLTYTFNTANTDSALFRVSSWLITDVFDPKINDTIVYYQKFSNYFAFDDGSSEGGYGINGQGSASAMVAFRFRSYMEDTLRAISICFNDSYLNANKRYFDLMVWDDNGDLPGTILTSLEEVMVEQGDELNGFYTYILPKGVMVDNVFYVGWRQRSETFLNAGFDINTPHNGKQFYWINGSWYQSGITGSIMIRPVTGPPLITSVNDILYKKRPLLHFWPNPAKDFISFDPEELIIDGLTYISCIDIRGREILKVPLTEKIDISSLHEGVYIIIASRKGRPYGYGRLIKIK